MKFDLSKIKYSGWVYFSSIIALPLVTSCCYADLIGTELKTDDDLKYFRCILNAKIIVANTIRDIHKVYQCDEWIKRAEYKDSIYNVIPTAIADCALGREEFAKEKINDGIVTFDNKDYEHYTAENWNALVLYNFINYLWPKTGTAESGNLYWWDHAGYFYKEIIQSGRLSNACGDNYANEIKDAYKDIVEYNKQLSLWSLICSIHCVSDKNLRRQGKPSNLDDVVYDVGYGTHRRNKRREPRQARSGQRQRIRIAFSGDDSARRAHIGRSRRLRYARARRRRVVRALQRARIRRAHQRDVAQKERGNRRRRRMRADKR